MALVLKKEMKTKLDAHQKKISERVQKANVLLKDFTFKKYDSDCICSVQLGLTEDSYNKVVDSIAASYKLSHGRKEEIKMLRLSVSSETKHITVHEAKGKGDVVYGRFVLSKQTNGLTNMAYAMYTANYEFEPNVKITKNVIEFLGIKWSYTETEYQYPQVPATESLMRAFFENKAIEALNDEY